MIFKKKKRISDVFVVILTLLKRLKGIPLNQTNSQNEISNKVHHSNFNKFERNLCVDSKFIIRNNLHSSNFYYSNIFSFAPL